MNYIDTLDDDFKEYFKLLSNDYPEWMDEYINTKELLQQQYVSVTCGKVYAKMFNFKRDFSSLNHSIGVALIIWNFTHDKKQTLSGLFHDIATPAFKHCIDYMRGDYMNQEATEDETKGLIENSKELMALLKRDNIDIDEVCDYHIYPIADNDTPMLSADRLEYSLSNACFLYDVDTFDSIKEIYNDIEVQHNEDGIIELGFKTKKYARQFVKNTTKLSICYRDDPTRYYMQLVADILKRLNDEQVITVGDLYDKKEKDIIDIMLDSKYGDLYNKVLNADKVKTSKEEPKDVYYVHHGAKIRYINPLFNGKRIYDECKIAKNYIDKNLSFNMNDYVYIENIML